MAFEHFVQSGTKQLRCGYTTGTCAALAAEGAAQLLLTGTAPKTLSVRTPKGWTVEVAPESCDRLPGGAARCLVRKDAGDDPDVTDGMPVVATVSLGLNGNTVTLVVGLGMPNENYWLEMKALGVDLADMQCDTLCFSEYRAPKLVSNNTTKSLGNVSTFKSDSI